MPYYCCIEGCGNTSEKYSGRDKYHYYNGKFIKFPDNPERRKKWNDALKLSGSGKKYICSEHFPVDAWRLQDVIMNLPLAKRRLKADAVPLVNGEHQIISQVVQSEHLNEINAMTINYNQPNTGMNYETRKRLVAEALAEYEESMLQKINIDGAKIMYNKKKRRKTTNINYAAADTATDFEFESYIDIKSNSIKEEDSLEMKMPISSRYDFRRRCGEITVDVNNQKFALNCTFCTEIALNLNDFMEHIKEQHKSLLNLKDVKHAEYKTSKDSDIFVAEAVPLPQLVDNIDIPVPPPQEIQQPQQELVDLNDEPLITEVIDQLKINTILWDKSHPMHECFRQRKSVIISILQKLMKHFPGTALNYKHLIRIMQRLRTAYRSHLNNKKGTAIQDSDYMKKYWFINKLTFLGDDDLNMTTNNYDMHLDNCKKIASQSPFDMVEPQKEFSMLEIIEMYEQRPSLWNLNHNEYKGKFKNEESMQELLKSIAQINPFIVIKTMAQLREQLHALNCWFSAEEYLRFRLNKTDSAMNYESVFPHLYMSLEFLQGHVAPFTCYICKRIFHTEPEYIKHTRSKVTHCSSIFSGVVHKCQYCGKLFPKAPNLKRHIRLHTNERPYKCKSCEKSFRNYSTWFRHGRTHTQHKPFKCTDCERCFYTNSMLCLHQKSHLGIRDKVCDICGKTFTLAKNLYRHRDIHLKDNQRRKIACELCQRTFKTQASMHTHRRRCATSDALAAPKIITNHRKPNEIAPLEQQLNQVKTIVTLKKNHTVVECENSRKANAIEIIKEEYIATAHIIPLNHIT